MARNVDGPVEECLGTHFETSDHYNNDIKCYLYYTLS